MARDNTDVVATMSAAVGSVVASLLLGAFNGSKQRGSELATRSIGQKLAAW